MSQASLPPQSAQPKGWWRVKSFQRLEVDLCGLEPLSTDGLVADVEADGEAALSL